jgi:hypothetical protein
MIRFTLPVIFDLGFSKENIITSLEMRMASARFTVKLSSMSPFMIIRNAATTDLAVSIVTRVKQGDPRECHVSYRDF